MTGITMDTAVKQELETRGINESTGVYGQHQVKLSKSPAIRLDNIKSASVPFAGFRTATKIARGKEGIIKSADNVLNVLSGQADKLDVKSLLGNLKALSTHCSRLDALGQLNEAQRADGSWTFTSSVEKMSNAQLASVFQTFASSEMDLLQTALIHEGRNNPDAKDARMAAEQLFDLQALIIKEISNRSINEQISQEAADLSFEGLPENDQVEEAVDRPETLSQRFGSVGGAGNTVHANDITAANLVSLAETAAGSANIRERTAKSADENLNARRIDNVTVKEIGDAIRNSELTINIKTEYLIGGNNSILKHPNDPMVNIFHLHDQGIDPKGAGYLSERDTTEKVLFPELKGHDVNANERPVYGALNIQGNSVSALNTNKGYGSSAIILKPHVAKRATYTVNDTFYSTSLNTSQERRQNFYKLLDGVNNPENSSKLFGEKIPQTLIDALKKPDSKERQEFEKFLDAIKGKNAVAKAFDALPKSLCNHFKNAAQLQNPGADARTIDNAEESIMGAFKGFFMQVFGDSEATRSKMATYDNVESLITQMDEIDSVSLARATVEAKSGKNFTAVPDNLQYIEAQIQGPLIPSRDIAEIRLYVDDIPEDEQDARIQEAEKFGKENGIKITIVGGDDEELDSNQVSRAQAKDVEFGKQHHNLNKLNQIKNDYINNMSDKIQEYISNNKNLTKDLPEGTLRLEGNALAAFVSKFEQAISSELKNEISVSTEESTVRRAFESAIKPVISLKADLLREVHKMDLNEAQKAEVTKWVVAAKALRTPEELKVVLQNAQNQSQMFREMVNAQPPLTTQEALLKIADFTKKMDSDISAMLAESYKGREVGPDDTMTEMNRISFMSLTLLKNANPPLSKDEITRLTDIFDGPEMRQMSSQLDHIKVHSQLSKKHSVASIDVLVSHLFINAQNLRAEAGESYRHNPAYTGNFNLIQAPVRNVLTQLSPALGQSFAELYPPYPEFPAPVKPDSMPQNAKDRRDFLVKIMDSYINHEKTFEYGVSTHGRGHIARAYIFADVMCNILGEKGIKVDKNAVLCGIAGHDAGRKGGGSDYWEQRSANITADAMKSSFGDDSMGENYEQEVKDCIDKHKSKTIESMVLNSADSLDIGRVGIGYFEMDKFMFLKPENAEESDKEIEALRKELAKEADLLQRLTNPLCANRQMLDKLDMQIINSTGSQSDELSKVKEDIRKGITQVFQKDLEVSSDEYMKRFEDTIKNNPQMFPVLSKYYSGNTQAA